MPTGYTQIQSDRKLTYEEDCMTREIVLTNAPAAHPVNQYNLGHQ